MKIFMKILLFSTVVMLPINAGNPQIDKLTKQAQKDASEVTAKELKAMLDKDDNVIMLDVRKSEQRAEGEIYADNHIAIPRGSLEFHIMDKVKSKDAVIVAYCRAGVRSAFAAQTLKKLGYKNAHSLKDGLRGWAKAGYPIETGLGETTLLKK